MEEFDILAFAVEEITGFTREEFISKKRKRYLVELRVVCANILKENKSKITCEKIGELMNVDHSTVVHYTKLHPTLMGHRDGKYKKKFTDIKNKFVENLLSSDYNTKNELLEKKKKMEESLSIINRVLQKMEEQEKKMLESKNLTYC